MQTLYTHDVTSIRVGPVVTSTLTTTGEFYHRDIVIKHKDGMAITITLFSESASNLQVAEATVIPETLL